jgi:hypothetical protein
LILSLKSAIITEERERLVMKKIIILIIILLLLISIGLVVFLYIVPRTKDPAKINSFEDCATAGNLVVDTHPRECHMKDGRIFTEDGNAKLLKEVIQVTDPAAKTKVVNPFKVEGKALGSWYYNEQLAVKLYDGAGKIIATVNPKAQEEITDKNKNQLIHFIGVIHFQAPGTAKGRLVIERTNPVLDKNGMNGPLVIPVQFR